jgi:D-arabinose 1-dehydrogenase-like Zn-dependent alcohol dehydrogenase
VRHFHTYFIVCAKLKKIRGFTGFRASLPRSITIKVSYVGNREDARQALDMVARGRVQTTCCVEPLARLPQVFDEMQEGKFAGRVVLDLVSRMCDLTLLVRLF